MNEAALIEKLHRIEALHAGATTDGERAAAANARERIMGRLRELQEADPPVEYRFRVGDRWQKKLFLALLRRYDLEPYRYKRQRYTTVMVMVSPSFVEEVLRPEFEELSDELETYLEEVTNRVVSQVLHPDQSEQRVVDDDSALPPGPS